MAWIYLLIAGCCETLGVVFMNQWTRSKRFLPLLYLGITFCASFLFLSLAMRSITMGTAYAIWTGIGTVGGTLVGMFFYGESKDWKRLLCIAGVLSSAVGLKLIS